MCYCQPNVRTTFCNNCAPRMFQDIQAMKEQRDELLDALKHLEHNAIKSGANMGIALDVSSEAIAKATSK